MIFVLKLNQVIITIIITITVISTGLTNPASTCHQDRLVDIKTSCGAFSTPLFCMRNATYVCVVLLLSFYGPQETRQNFTICQIRYYRKPYKLYSIRLRKCISESHGRTSLMNNASIISPRHHFASSLLSTSFSCCSVS